MRKGYHILEVANVHGGDFGYFKKLIQGIEKYKSPDFGVKLQVLKADLLALSDFSFYNVYEELYFNLNEWEEIISLANETKDVWIDIFDLYGVEIVEKFQNKIYGIKFQASVLDNIEVFNALAKLDMQDKYVVINIAGIPLDRIQEKIDLIKSKLSFHKILLQVGFQSYPTPVAKSALNKIKTIKEKFGYEVIYADHTEGENDDTYLVPVLALHAGAFGIEKHIMLGDEKTKYDFQASITLEQLEKYLGNYRTYFTELDPAFINDLEKEYLRKSIQKPVTKVLLENGKSPKLDDFHYRRTDFDGITLDEIKDLVSAGYVLRDDIKANKTLRKEDFKKPIVAAIVACRLKSSRLKEKALEKIGSELTSIEMCMKNTMKIHEANHVILATSDLDSDAPLKDFTYHDSVIFHKGDPEDVIKRYLDICDVLKVDTVIRITGDCPYISSEIISKLYESHRLTGADYSAVREAAVGTAGEIIEVSALRKIKDHFGSADYSEYMTWYFMNNPEHFKINKIDLPSEMVRGYRLTLDYQEDLDLFNIIDHYFEETKKEFTLWGMLDFLDSNPKIAEINNMHTLKYKSDQDLIDTLNRETKIK